MALAESVASLLLTPAVYNMSGLPHYHKQEVREILGALPPVFETE